MIRGIFIFFSSLILLSESQLNHLWSENTSASPSKNHAELLATDNLTFESAEHPGQLGDIRLLKQKNSKTRITSSTLWFVSKGSCDPICFVSSKVKPTNVTAASGKILQDDALPLYLELNKLII